MSFFTRIKEMIFGQNGYDAEAVEEEVQSRKDTSKRCWDEHQKQMDETIDAFKLPESFRKDKKGGTCEHPSQG